MYKPNPVPANKTITDHNSHPTIQQEDLTSKAVNDDDDDEKKYDDEEFWDAEKLMAIQLIETDYYSNPRKKKLQKLSPSSTTSTQAEIAVSGSEENRKRIRITRVPIHLDIQVKHQSPKPSHPRILQNILSHRFDKLKPSSTNHGLYQRFRAQRGFLSVSDLVSCLWCEVQVEYGLLAKRYLKPSQRPKSFISSSGLEIHVNTQAVLTRQKILDGGIKVHNQLEKEVAPEKVQVQVISKVDSWGLKVLNTIVSLSLLRSTGMMREIPVWGFVGGFLIQGIVDQIELIPRYGSSSSSPSSKDNLEQGDPKPRSIEGTDSKEYVVRISDSKTTQGESLPVPAFTESARYQLMLYKYLYDQHASGSFDLERFSRHLGLDLDEVFSERFMDDAQPVLASVKRTAKPTTLREIFGLYEDLISRIGVSQSILEIVYRRRGTTRAKLSTGVRKKKIGAKDEDRSSESVLVEAVDPSVSISSQELKVSGRSDEVIDSSEPGGVGGPVCSKDGLDRMDSSWMDDELVLEEVLVGLSPGRSSLDSLRAKYERVSNEIVGSYQFSFHPIEFYEFIDHTISLWNGDLEPIGVDIQSSNKCSPCEFRESCEWRAKD